MSMPTVDLTSALTRMPPTAPILVLLLKAMFPTACRWWAMKAEPPPKLLPVIVAFVVACGGGGRRGGGAGGVGQRVVFSRPCLIVVGRGGFVGPPPRREPAPADANAGKGIVLDRQVEDPGCGIVDRTLEGNRAPIDLVEVVDSVRGASIHVDRAGAVCDLGVDAVIGDLGKFHAGDGHAQVNVIVVPNDDAFVLRCRRIRSKNEVDVRPDS